VIDVDFISETLINTEKEIIALLIVTEKDPTNPTLYNIIILLFLLLHGW